MFGKLLPIKIGKHRIYKRKMSQNAIVHKRHGNSMIKNHKKIKNKKK